MDSKYEERKQEGLKAKAVLEPSSKILLKLSESMRVEAQSQILARRLDFLSRDSRDPSTITQETITWFEERWSTLSSRLQIISGKKLLHAFRSYVQESFGITITSARILDEIKIAELPSDIQQLANKLNTFCKK